MDRPDPRKTELIIGNIRGLAYLESVINEWQESTNTETKEESDNG